MSETYGSHCCLLEKVRQGLHAETESLIASVMPGQYIHMHALSKVLLGPRCALLCKMLIACVLKLSWMTILLCPFKMIPLQTPSSSLKLKQALILSGIFIEDSGKPLLLCSISNCTAWSFAVWCQILSTESELKPVNSSMACMETSKFCIVVPSLLFSWVDYLLALLKCILAPGW